MNGRVRSTVNRLGQKRVPALTRIGLHLCGAFLLLILLCGAAPASSVYVDQVELPETVQVTMGKSIILKSERPIHRVSMASPDFADMLLLSPRQVYLTGKAPGVTNLTLWSSDKEIMRVFNLEVNADLTQLKAIIHNVMPDESGIKVLPSKDSITLAGPVSSAVNMSTALSLAQAYSAGKVLNLMQVGGVHQVMLEVKIAEVARSLVDRLGFNFRYVNGGDIFYSFLNGLSFLDEDGILRFSNDVTGLFSLGGDSSEFTGFLDALKTDGLVKILAEPNLICLSGQTASFLAGGEIPVPVPQGLGTVGIEWKAFGVGLKFTPSVLGGNRIHMQVTPEVSELDFSNAVLISSVTIPAITSRRASTTVELDSGQSFAIAGLLKESVKEDIQKFPILGDIPILGKLFRSSSFQKNETELIIIVTPHLAKPLNVAKQTLPTDQFTATDTYPRTMYRSKEAAAKEEEEPAPSVDTSSREPASGTGTAGFGFDGSFGHSYPK